MPPINAQTDNNNEEEVSLRESLESAIEQHEEQTDETKETSQVVEAEATQTEPPAEGVQEGAADTQPAASDAPGSVQQPPAATTPPDAQSTSAEHGDQDARAPGSWTPAAREKWNSLDPDIRKEIWRRERDVSRAMTQSTNARRLEQEFNQTIQPYMGFIAAERSTPLQAVQNMMQTAATLRVGTPQQKVQIAAEIIRNFGIDLQALDSVLAGQSPEFDQRTQIEQLINERVRTAIGERQQQAEASQQEQVRTSAMNEVEAFAKDPKNEFYEDVRHIMGDLIAGASQRGEVMELSDAYARAILIHEPVRRVIEGRQAQSQATSRHVAAQRSRRASASVVPSAAVTSGAPAGPQDDSVRAAIEFAFSQQQGR